MAKRLTAHQAKTVAPTCSCLLLCEDVDKSEKSKAEARWLEKMSRTHRPPQEWYDDQTNPFES